MPTAYGGQQPAPNPSFPEPGGFTPQQVQYEFLTTDLLQQLGSSFWIGLQKIRNQQDQLLNLTSGTATIYNSGGSSVATLTLAIQADGTFPPSQMAGVLLQTGSGKTLTSADTYRAVYSLVNKTGEVAVIQQTFVLRSAPF
jgi:hypothetical protein